MWRICGLWPVLSMVAGCVQTEFEVELTPVDNRLERRLTIKRHGPNATPEELQHLATVYEADVPKTLKLQEFRHEYTGRMPADIGGHGTFTHWKTPFGSASLYAERFRGSDDVAAEWGRREAAANRLAELLTGWLEQEFRGDPGLPQLKLFVHGPLRRDLLNVGLYVWSAGLTHHDQANPAPFVRIVQYLVERDYVSYDEAPALMRAIADCQRDDYQRLFEIAQRKLIARARDDVFAESLRFLETPELLQASLRRYLESTDEYRRLSTDWENAVRRDPSATRPDPFEVVSPHLKALLTGAVSPGGDQLALSLRTGRPPLATNGKWSQGDERVIWPEEFLPEDGQPPLLTYAAWEQPDVAAQQAKLGRVALQGQALVTYCLWYHGLTEAEQTEWNQFVETLRPENELETKLQAFRFRDEPADQAGVAAPAVDAILTGLKATQQ